MIEIQGIGIYDETKSVDEQPSASVGTYLQTIVESFNDLTAVERDQWNRPTRWHHDVSNVRVVADRTYCTEDGNYFLKEQTYKVIEHGNI